MERLSAPEGDIQWGAFFQEDRSNSQLDAQIREVLTGMDFQTSLQLLIYVQNMRELYRRGWDLPNGITEEDLDYLEDLARGN
jgi:hypothetical protein